MGQGWNAIDTAMSALTHHALLSQKQGCGSARRPCAVHPAPHFHISTLCPQRGIFFRAGISPGDFGGFKEDEEFKMSPGMVTPAPTWMQEVIRVLEPDLLWSPGLEAVTLVGKLNGAPKLQGCCC